MTARMTRQTHGDEAGAVRAARVSHRPRMARSGWVRPGRGPAARQWARELRWGPALEPWPKAAPAGQGLALASPQRYWGPHPKATSGKGQLWAVLALGPTARPSGGQTCSAPWHYFIWTSYTYTSTVPI